MKTFVRHVIPGIGAIVALALPCAAQADDLITLHCRLHWSGEQMMPRDYDQHFQLNLTRKVFCHPLGCTIVMNLGVTPDTIKLNWGASDYYQPGKFVYPGGGTGLTFNRRTNEISGTHNVGGSTVHRWYIKGNCTVEDGVPEPQATALRTLSQIPDEPDTPSPPKSG